jgi:hypothetical protein
MRINMADSKAVQDWLANLRTDRKSLMDAVRVVGPKVVDIANFLQRKN